MNDYPILCAIDNRGVPGMDHCFGAPFIAKDVKTAQKMVKEAIGDKKDVLNLKMFELVIIAGYDITAECPIYWYPDDLIDRFSVWDIFYDEDTVDELADEDPDDESEVLDEQE